MSGVDAPAPFRIAFDNARDPYTARNALGITSTGGGSGAPTNAEYITAASDPTLTNERVLTNTATVTWDFTTPGQAKANASGGGGGGGNVSNSGTPVVGQYAKWVTSTTIQGVSPATVLSDIGAQPLDADLTAIAALTGTNTIYYRSAANTWSPVVVSTGLSFTSGTLTCTVSAGGNVSNVGTPTSGQFARWTGATTIEGRTATQVTADLDVFTGDTGSGGLKGLVKAPSAGDAAKYLRGDATWAAGTTAATQGNLVLITSQTNGSNVATVTFTSGIGSTYDEYEFHLFNVKPVTSTVGLQMQISQDSGSTWKTAAAAYSYAYLYTGTAWGGAQGSDVAIWLTAGDQVNTSGTGASARIRFAVPSSSSISKLFDFSSAYWASGAYRTMIGGGGYNTDNNAINGIRFKFSSGNIATGSTFILYGVVK